MNDAVRVGILGDFNPHYHTHPATNASIEDAAARMGIPVMAEWLATPSLLEAAWHRDG